MSARGSPRPVNRCKFIVQQKNNDMIDIDELVKSQISSLFVISVKAGIEQPQLVIDSSFRGNDIQNDFLRCHQH